MSQYTDGYTPQRVRQSLSIWDDVATPQVSISFEVSADVGNHPAQAAAALAAGVAAIEASLEAAFPGVTASVNGASITGSKALS